MRPWEETDHRRYCRFDNPVSHSGNIQIKQTMMAVRSLLTDGTQLKGKYVSESAGVSGDSSCSGVLHWLFETASLVTEAVLLAFEAVLLAFEAVLLAFEAVSLFVQEYFNGF